MATPSTSDILRLHVFRSKLPLLGLLNCALFLCFFYHWWRHLPWSCLGEDPHVFWRDNSYKASSVKLANKMHTMQKYRGREREREKRSAMKTYIQTYYVKILYITEHHPCRTFTNALILRCSPPQPCVAHEPPQRPLAFQRASSKPGDL